MEFDDRPESAKRLEQARIAKGFANPRAAAMRYGWKYETYIQHEKGMRGLTRAAKDYAKAFGVSEAWLRGIGEDSGATDASEQSPSLEEQQFLDRLSRLKADQRSVLRALMDVMGAAAQPAPKRSPARKKREA